MRFLAAKQNFTCLFAVTFGCGIPAIMHPNRKETTMKLFTPTEYDQLVENGKPKNHGKDHKPVVKLFVPGASLVLTELRSEKPLMAYGLCDTGTECKLSHIDLDQVTDLAIRSGSEIKKAEKFKAKSPISVYLDAAQRRKTIWEIQSILNKSQSVH